MVRVLGFFKLCFQTSNCCLTLQLCSPMATFGNFFRNLFEHGGVWISLIFCTETSPQIFMRTRLMNSGLAVQTESHCHISYTLRISVPHMKASQLTIKNVRFCFFFCCSHCHTDNTSVSHMKKKIGLWPHFYLLFEHSLSSCRQCGCGVLKLSDVLQFFVATYLGTRRFKADRKSVV